MSARAWAVFGAVSVLWGFPYLLIKIAIDDGMPPLALAWTRIAIGAVLLLAIAWRSGTLPTLRPRAGWVLAFALVEIAIPFPLIALGEQTIASSTAAIVIATAPLMVALLVIRFDQSERVGSERLVGLLVGLVGVVALVGLDLGGRSGEALGLLAVFVAAFGYACGALIVRRHLAELDPVAMIGAALAIATIVLAPFAALSFPSASPSAGAIACVLALAILSTALALVLMARLIVMIGATRAVVITYVNPVIALVLGIVFLSESPGAGSIVGLALILLGSWLATGGRLGFSRMRPVRQTD